MKKAKLESSDGLIIEIGSDFLEPITVWNAHVFRQYDDGLRGFLLRGPKPEVLVDMALIEAKTRLPA